jgi:hypothetical protein
MMQVLLGAGLLSVGIFLAVLAVALIVTGVHVVADVVQ